MASKKTGVKKKLSIVRPNVIIKTFSGRSIKFARLQRVNFVLAGLYALQAVLVMVFGHSIKLPVSVDYLTADPLQSAAQHKTVLTLAAHHWFDINLLAAVAAFLLLAAVLHLVLATVCRVRYEAALTKGLNDLRWAGYAIIGGLVLIIVGLLVGISDAAVLLALFGLCVLMALGALAIEANKRLWPWALFAIVAGAAAWLVVGIYTLSGVVYGTALPAYAYYAAGLVLLGALGAAGNLWLQIRGKDQWADYSFAEEGYIALNFVVGSAFAWLIFAGALHT